MATISLTAKEVAALYQVLEAIRYGVNIKPQDYEAASSLDNVVDKLDRIRHDYSKAEIKKYNL